jgi:urease accessory protein
VGGDRLVIEVEAGPGAHACLTTPSATRVYRTEGEPAVQDVSLRLGPGAVVEWVPDHTIPFAGSAFRQSIHARIGEGARLILVDAFAAGRVVRGEAWGFDHLESALLVEDARGPLLHDRFRLGGGAAWAGLGFTEERPYFATVVVVADEGLGDLEEALGDGWGSRPEVRVGLATLPRRGVLVRCLAASAPALGEALEVIWSAARRTVLGAPALALRKP